MFKIEKTANVEYSYELIKFDNYDEYQFNITNLDVESPINFKLNWRRPVQDIQFIWKPELAGSIKTIVPDFCSETLVKGTVLSSAVSFFNYDNKSRYSVAFSDSVNTMGFLYGISEETGDLILQFNILKDKNIKLENYKFSIYISEEEKPLNKSIKDLDNWLQQFVNPMEVSQAAFDPVFSTWYNFHQNVFQDEMLEQAKLAKEIGLKTFMLDDGWQTNDNNRGYAYTGDWEICEEKFPDFKQHVKDVQDLGLNYVVWFGVPFIGKESKAFDQFKDKLIFYREELSCGVIDIRYKECRDFLKSKFVDFAIENNVDGLKLDFIDEFDLERANPEWAPIKPEMDVINIQDAVFILLNDVRSELQAFKEDFLFEFRQKYIGTKMQEVGNMFRVCDCPYNSMWNRIGIADLKLFSGKTAIHSDMIMWSKHDSVESAALQWINILFSVPQYSLKLDDITEEQIKMSKFFFDLWNEHKDVLLFGDFCGIDPHHNYPIMSSSNETENFASIHTNMIHEVKTVKNINTFVNGKFTEGLSIDMPCDLKAKLVIYNCLGEITFEGECDFNKGYNLLEVPTSGLAKIYKI